MPNVERKPVTVTAAKAFKYGGTPYAKGDRVEMSPFHAAVADRRGLVTLSPAVRNQRQMAVAQVPALRGRSRSKRKGKHS